MSADRPEQAEEAVPEDDPLWKQRLKDAVLGLSLANLVLANAWFEILYDKDRGYFNEVPVKTPTLLALMVNLAWLTGVAWLVMRVWRSTRNRAVRFAIHLLFLAALIFPVDFLRTNLLKIPDYQVVVFLKHPTGVALTAILLLLVIWQHRRVARFAAVVVVLFAPLALLTVAHTVLLLVGVLHLNQDDADPPLAALRPARPDLPRVIWIIFDETDYRLAFEQRPAGVALPNFDQLRRESLFATNAYSPGGATLISMPALISGQQLDSVKVAGPSELLIEPEKSKQKLDWRRLPSVFSLARDAGANTALVGWYHPYSRILAGSLSYCVWFPYMTSEHARAGTVGPALARELSAMLGTIQRRQLYVDLCRRGEREATALAGNADYNLMLFHLAPPHKPGIYLPADHRFTAFGVPKSMGYFNNLMLADRMLGAIRQSVVHAGLQDKTWLVISSDHWWRESAVYDGRVDCRVPFIVHPPRSGQGLEFGTMINTIVTHDLLLAILRGELHTVADTARWLEPRRIARPPNYRQQKESTD